MVIFGAMVALISAVGRSGAARRRRLDLLEQGLRDPELDPATRSELLRALAGQHTDDLRGAWARGLRSGAVWRAIWFGAAWFLFLIGGGLVAAERLDFVHGVDREIALPLAILGFAMLTLPAVLRELARRQPSSAGNR
ncbi:MAG: hypothetical protein KF830_17750 [Planctomycetes bacterium]|nr:hypothetical protein [Planctomycetota bacterium]